VQLYRTEIILWEMKKLYIRFYEELNDFLPASGKKKRFAHEFWGNPSVKDLIESLGVPHTEVDLILVNNKSVSFNYNINAEDDISVYPVFESFDISDVQHLRPEPLRRPKFVLDVHLGKLTHYLRMLGFDSAYKNNFSDETIVKISIKEKRTILTRDLGILKRSEVTHGYFVRNTNPLEQIKEVINRFQLEKITKKFSRCLECNGKLEQIDKELILNKIPDKVKLNQKSFYICSDCNKIYWQGTHFQNMSKILKIILS
jgi:uncharacterized protein